MVTTVKILFRTARPAFCHKLTSASAPFTLAVLANLCATATLNKMHLYRLLILYHRDIIKSIIKYHKLGLFIYILISKVAKNTSPYKRTCVLCIHILFFNKLNTLCPFNKQGSVCFILVIRNRITHTPERICCFIYGNKV